MPLAPAIRLGAGARGPCTGSFSKDAQALGIPDMGNYGRPTKDLTPGQLVKYVLQQHETARKPGRPHYDLRLGTPDTGLFSWAVPKASLPAPGEKRLAPQTQVHSYGYGDFTGRIGRGYGHGRVTMADNGKALITKVTPNSISFTVAHARHPQRYTLIRIPPEKLQTKDPQWLLLGVPVGRKGVPGVGKKPTYKLLRATDLDDALEQATQIQAKIDGAHAVYDIDEQGKLEAYSVRPSVTGEPIVHTERLGLAAIKLPHLRKSTFRGEIFATDPQGKATTFNELSGLLNANIDRSLEEQRKRQLTARNALFGVVRSKGKPFTGTPDEERALLEQVIKELPQDRFMLPAAAKTPEEKQQLLEAIRSGHNPDTGEGIVLHVGGRRAKFKLRPEVTMYLRGTYPGEGRRSRTAGGLLAGHDPDKPGQVRLGTGFTDAQLADIAANLPKYINRPVRVEHQGEFGSGLLRAPSFKGFELDKAAQWQVGPFTGIPSRALMPNQDTAQERMNAYWRPKIYRPRPADPAPLLSDIPRKKEDTIVSFTAPSGTTYRINATRLARDLGVTGDATSGILPDRVRTPLRAVLDKYNRLSESVDRLTPTFAALQAAGR